MPRRGLSRRRTEDGKGPPLRLHLPRLRSTPWGKRNPKRVCKNCYFKTWVLTYGGIKKAPGFSKMCLRKRCIKISKCYFAFLMYAPRKILPSPLFLTLPRKRKILGGKTGNGWWWCRLPALFHRWSRGGNKRASLQPQMADRSVGLMASSTCARTAAKLAPAVGNGALDGASFPPPSDPSLPTHPPLQRGLGVDVREDF